MKRKQTIDTLEVLQAFYQFAHARKEYTDERTEFYVPERDSPWHGSPGSNHHYSATRVFFHLTRGEDLGGFDFAGPYIPIIPEKEFRADLVFGRYVGPIEVFQQAGTPITSRRTLDQLAKNILADMKKIEAKH